MWRIGLRSGGCIYRSSGIHPPAPSVGSACAPTGALGSAVARVADDPAVSGWLGGVPRCRCRSATGLQPVAHEVLDAIRSERVLDPENEPPDDPGVCSQDAVRNLT